MKITVPYGHAVQTAEIPEEAKCAYARLSPAQPRHPAEEEIAGALRQPIGRVGWEKLKSARTVAIAVSDITRPAPSRIILTQLLAWLGNYGIGPEKIRILVGGGLHRPATTAEMENMIGRKIIGQAGGVFAHDADDRASLSFLGVSQAGTPVYVNQHFAAADFRIVTGVIDAHQFMGFTAGVKGAVIGLGGRATITANHARMFAPGAELGRIEDNPARLDLEDIGRIMNVDFIANVVLNDKKEVVYAVAGHPVGAHRAGVEIARKILGTKIFEADIVIASPGGFPKDINVYQAQKALTPAGQVVRPGGAIILVAECSQGTGEEEFEREMAKYADPAAIMEEFPKQEFVIGPHKAYLWARTLAKARTILVSDKIDPALAKVLMVELRPTLQEALDEVLTNVHTQRVAVLPNASSMIPIGSGDGRFVK